MAENTLKTAENTLKTGPRAKTNPMLPPWPLEPEGSKLELRNQRFEGQNLQDLTEDQKWSKNLEVGAEL